MDGEHSGKGVKSANLGQRSTPSSGDQGRVRVWRANAGEDISHKGVHHMSRNKADPVLVRISHNEKVMGCVGTDPVKRHRAETWWGPWAETQTSQELRGTDVTTGPQCRGGQGFTTGRMRQSCP